MKQRKEYTPLNILLADDDIDDRFIFEKALREIPVSTSLTSVSDGEQLMIYLNENIENLPDIIFLDLSMPRKTGFECLSEIKENELFANIPVIMLSTSYPRDINYEQGIINMLSKVGANEFIRKPHDYQELKKLIHRALTASMESGSLNEEGKYPSS